MTTAVAPGPSAEDFAMAVHGYFTPEELLEFLEAAPGDERSTVAARKVHHVTFSMRRLPFELEPGSVAVWEQAKDGFSYTIYAAAGARTLQVAWDELCDYVVQRATPEPFQRLRDRVIAARDHEGTYHPCFVPFRSPTAWNDVFYTLWSRRLHDLQLAATCARDAILPPVQPALPPVPLRYP
ncbi:hypothetical protein [Streptomyces sp. NPDC049555]|uniref:hypothetical protein n=1 Tax=Streptomyces sp. NPDC049555 TaxID=3154930 RepID=UPI00342FBCDA